MNLSKLIRVCASIQAAVLLAAYAPTEKVYAAAPAPDWHVAKTRYETNDYIIAGYEAKDFGITANGRTDVTDKIQTSLNALYNIGGGTLFLPAGRYSVKGTLKIPQGVTLAGDWQSPKENGGNCLPHLLSSTLDITTDAFTVTFPDGGYSDINNPDTKEDGTAQYKYGFRIFEIEAYGSKEPIWSGDVSQLPASEPVTIPEIPDKTEDTLSLTAEQSESGIILNASADLITATDTDYTAIIAIYSQSGALTYISSRGNVKVSTENLEFDGILLPEDDYYRAVLFRWNSLNAKTGMLPLSDTIEAIYMKGR